jgi:hypothetical protein
MKKMKTCNAENSCHLENLIIEYLKRNPRSSIVDIAMNISYPYIEIYRVLNGRQGSLSNIGLVSNNYVKVVPGISSKGRLCWHYEVI